MTSTFAITKIAHPGLRGYSVDCDDCLALGEEAAIMARASGSVGATYNVTSPGGLVHSATVARVIGMVKLS